MEGEGGSLAPVPAKAWVRDLQCSGCSGCLPWAMGLVLGPHIPETLSTGHGVNKFSAPG